MAHLDQRVSAVSSAIFEDMADYTLKQLVEEGKLDYIQLIMEEIRFDINARLRTKAVRPCYTIPCGTTSWLSLSSSWTRTSTSTLATMKATRPYIMHAAIVLY